MNGESHFFIKQFISNIKGKKLYKNNYVYNTHNL